jgi:hypothetical protein
LTVRVGFGADFDGSDKVLGQFSAVFGTILPPRGVGVAYMDFISAAIVNIVMRFLLHTVVR